MKNGNKTWIILAASLIAAGLLIFAGAMIALDFDFTVLNTVKYETNTYTVSDGFSRLSIDAGAATIEFVLSDEAQCKIVCLENEKLTHSAVVKDGTLTIGTVDSRKWYDHIGFSFGEPKMTVYLPKAEYAELLIKGSTGDIEIPKDFQFETVAVSASTGSVTCCASASKSMKITLSTGTIRVGDASVGALDLSVTTGAVNASSILCAGDVQVSVSTGKTKLTDITCRSVMSTGSTGSITLKNVIAAERVSIERSTGDILFDGSDAAELSVKTSTGDVTGTLLSEKVFITETGTGSVNVPKTITGGRCEIKTSTGDIQIEIR